MQASASKGEAARSSTLAKTASNARRARRDGAVPVASRCVPNGRGIAAAVFERNHERQLVGEAGEDAAENIVEWA